LSEQQIAQIREIRNQSRERAKAAWSNDAQTVGALKKQLKALREDRKAKIEAVLTPDQRAKIDKAMGRVKRKSTGGRVPPPGA
jgi:Spy/CpxP family protein refolding chaperone